MNTTSFSYKTFGFTRIAHFRTQGNVLWITTREPMPDETICEIHIREVLDEKWAEAFSPFTLTFGEDETVLTGTVQDQAELFGVLLKIRDLGLTLVSLAPVRTG